MRFGVVFKPKQEVFPDRLLMKKRDDERDPKPSAEEGALDRLRPSYPELPKIISFESLARCGNEVWIENNGQIYRLRKTKQDKLILTK